MPTLPRSRRTMRRRQLRQSTRYLHFTPMIQRVGPSKWPAPNCVKPRASPRSSSTQPLNIKRDLTNLWNAFSRRRPASFTYRDARGNENIHTVDLYGSFERGSYVYLVGRDMGQTGCAPLEPTALSPRKAHRNRAGPTRFPPSSTSPALNSSPLTSPHATPSWRNSPFRPAWALTRSNSSPKAGERHAMRRTGRRNGPSTYGTLMPQRDLPSSTLISAFPFVDPRCSSTA